MGEGKKSGEKDEMRRKKGWSVRRRRMKRVRVGCPRNEKNNFSVRTETNRNKICFAFVSVCFVKPKTFLFRFVSVFRTCIETTETNRTVSKRTETILNFLKNTWIFSLLQFTITIQSNQKDIIRFCWSLYCYFYNCTLQYINVNIFRNLSLS